MPSKFIKGKELKKKTLEFFKRTHNFKVNNASNELMLDRINNGKTIEFPFS